MSGAVINRPFCYQFHFSIQLKRKENDKLHTTKEENLDLSYKIRILS